MSWVAAASVGGSLINSQLGLGGSSSGGAAPTGPVDSGKVTHGDFVFGGKGNGTASGASAPSWIAPLVIGILSVLSLGLIFLLIPGGKRRKE